MYITNDEPVTIPVNDTPAPMPADTEPLFMPRNPVLYHRPSVQAQLEAIADRVRAIEARLAALGQGEER